MQTSHFLFSLSFCLFLTMDIGSSEALSWWDMSPQDVREKINQRIMGIEAPTPAVWSVADLSVKHENRNTPIRVYLPGSEGNYPVILFIHGGAWVAGNLDTHDNLARYLCSETNAAVVSVGYLNAPEGKFPFPLEQCYDVLEQIAGASPIAVVGDSAGGNMAAALCLMAKDRSGPKIDLQVLINPAPDLSCNGTIIKQSDDLDTLRWQAFQYVSDPDDIYNPYVSPLLAKDLSGLPAAVILLAEKDALREKGQQYAARLRSADVITHIYCQEKADHLAGYGARAALYARESLDVAVSHIKYAFFGKF